MDEHCEEDTACPSKSRPGRYEEEWWSNFVERSTQAGQRTVHVVGPWWVPPTV